MKSGDFMKDGQRINLSIRNCSPCKDCTERFPACSSKCPKDLRGEYGYMAWKAEVDRVNKARKAFMDKRKDDTKRRETWGIKK